MSEGRKDVRAAGVLFLGIVVIRVLVFFINGWMGSKWEMDSLLLLFFSQACYIIPAVLFVFIYKGKGERKENLHLKGMKIPTVLLLMVIAFLCLPILATVNAFSMLFTENVTVSLMDNVVPDHSYLFLVFVIAITPALMEEFVYRGTLFGEFQKSGLWKGILLSALLFGLMHMNLNQMLYATVFGIFMAAAVELTGSLFASVLMHGLINGLSITSSYFILQNNEFMQSTGEISKAMIILAMILYAIISIGALAGIIALFWVIAKLEDRMVIWQRLNPFCKTAEERFSVFSIPLLLGMLICIGFVIFNFL